MIMISTCKLHFQDMLSTIRRMLEIRARKESRHFIKQWWYQRFYMAVNGIKEG